jgi:hypothetical protein
MPSRTTPTAGLAKTSHIANAAWAIRFAASVFAVASGLFSPVRVTATSVVALLDRSNHKLVIAANCLVKSAPGFRPEFKIVENPGCTVVMAGLYREDSTGFDLRRLVDAACRYPET